MAEGALNGGGAAMATDATLPYTGDTTALLAALAAMGILTGGGLVVASRRINA